MKVSLAVGQEAALASGLPVKELPSVFSSSSGDAVNCHEICSQLASGDRLISPTRFHNSVHNAAAGYWGIATGARAPSTTLAGYDGSFALGLLEAGTQIVTERHPVLLVAFDVPAPEPMQQARTHDSIASCALWLLPQDVAEAAGAPRLQMELTDDAETTLGDAALDGLRDVVEKRELFGDVRRAEQEQAVGRHRIRLSRAPDRRGCEFPPRRAKRWISGRG